MTRRRWFHKAFGACSFVFAGVALVCLEDPNPETSACAATATVCFFFMAQP